MDELLIGKIVTTLAVGVPTAYWIGRLFHDIFKGKIISWANQAGYDRGFDQGWSCGYHLAESHGKREPAERVAKRVEKELIAVIGQELGDGDI